MFTITRKILLAEHPEQALVFTNLSIVFNLAEENILTDDILNIIKEKHAETNPFMLWIHITDENGDMVKYICNIGIYNHETEECKLTTLNEWTRKNYWHDKMQRENTKFIIMGKSASGKDTFCRKMEEILGITSAVSYTTRPMRPGEINGVDYHFISEKEFNKMSKQGKFLTTKSYNTEHGIWYYGKSLNEFMKHDYIILTPEERTDFINAVGNIFDLKTIYFMADENIRKKRSLNRKDNINEVNRRLKTDEKDFKEFEESLQKELPFGNHTIVDTSNMKFEDYDNTILKIATMWSDKELPFI